MTANDFTIGDLFAQRGPFHVPKYQRSYAWEDEALRDFVRDLGQVYQARTASKFIKHFFGGVVCLQHMAQNAMGRRYEVIDGQQRLATFGLFFAAVRHANIRLAEKCMLEGDDGLSKLAESRANRILGQYLEFADEVDGKPVQQPRIILSKADKDFYAAVLNRIDVTPIRESHRLLRNASARLTSSFGVCSRMLARTRGNSQYSTRSLNPLQKIVTSFIWSAMSRERRIVFSKY